MYAGTTLGFWFWGGRGLGAVSNGLSVSPSVLLSEPPNSGGAKAPSAPPPSNVVPGMYRIKNETWNKMSHHKFLLLIFFHDFFTSFAFKFDRPFFQFYLLCNVIINEKGIKNSRVLFRKIITYNLLGTKSPYLPPCLQFHMQKTHLLLTTKYRFIM